MVNKHYFFHVQELGGPMVCSTIFSSCVGNATCKLNEVQFHHGRHIIIANQGVYKIWREHIVWKVKPFSVCRHAPRADQNIENMDMYCCGFNGFGQIQTSSSNSEHALFKLNNVTDVAFSYSSMIIFSENDVLISGFVGGKASQLKRLTLPVEGLAIQVSCSSKQALFVTDAGECWQYMHHSETWKKLSDFTTVEGETVMSQSKADSEVSDTKNSACRITRVCCGDAINIALDEFGRVYSIPSPLDMPGIKVTEVVCGIEHCVLLDETGVVYTWGSGTRGQLGHGEVEFEASPPHKVEALCGLRIIKIAAGGWHSAIISDTGDLYTWGWNNTGQLGFPMTKSNLRNANRYKKSTEQVNEEYLSSIKQASISSKCNKHVEEERQLPINSNLNKGKSVKCLKAECVTIHCNSEHCVESEDKSLPKMQERKMKKMKLCDTGELDENSVKNSKHILEINSNKCIKENIPNSKSDDNTNQSREEVKSCDTSTSSSEDGNESKGQSNKSNISIDQRREEVKGCNTRSSSSGDGSESKGQSSKRDVNIDQSREEVIGCGEGQEHGFTAAVAVAVLPEPWPVDFPLGIDVNVVDVSCGNRHTVVMLDDGSIWGCGWNAYGQLGKLSDTLLYSSKMIKITCPFDLKVNKVVAVRCGAWNTAILVETQEASLQQQE